MLVNRYKSRSKLLTYSHTSLPTYCKKNGGGDRVRTCDHLRARQVLSQLSYAPSMNYTENTKPSME
jgi:hypothetical protein